MLNGHSVSKVCGSGKVHVHQEMCTHVRWLEGERELGGGGGGMWVPGIDGLYRVLALY
jgi:hypothetical protein